MGAAHSPVPFAIDGEGAIVACLSGRHRIEITATLEANVLGVHTDERDAANAAFIVRAVNNHEALLAACKGALKKDPATAVERRAACIAAIKLAEVE